VSNPSKQKGTAFETACVRYLQAQGFDARRIALSGSADSGDIAVEGFVLEAKNRKGYAIGEAVDQAKLEALQNAIRNARTIDETPKGQPRYAAVIKRVGKGDPARAFVVMELEQFAEILDELAVLTDYRNS
jgi:Holliday junction resolvase